MVSEYLYTVMQSQCHIHFSFFTIRKEDSLSHGSRSVHRGNKISGPGQAAQAEVRTHVLDFILHES